MGFKALAGSTPAPSFMKNTTGTDWSKVLVGKSLVEAQKLLKDKEYDGFVRVWAPQSAGTMEYISDRINLETSSKNVVTRVFFG